MIGILERRRARKHAAVRERSAAVTALERRLDRYVAPSARGPAPSSSTVTAGAAPVHPGPRPSACGPDRVPSEAGSRPIVA